MFAFVNAPLFATFLLGMFWKRATGHGAFFGLLAGTAAAALHHGLTLPMNAVVGHQRRLARRSLHAYPSEMAQNFWTAIWAWTTCFVVTIADQPGDATARRARTGGPGLFADTAHR